MCSCVDRYLGAPTCRLDIQVGRQARTCIPPTLSRATRENHNTNTIQVRSLARLRPGYVTELHTRLNETYELAVQRSSDVTTSSDRRALRFQFYFMYCVDSLDDGSSTSENPVIW